jgi:N-formylglutamate deformylase
MILGNNDETTAAPQLIKTALKSLRSGKFEVSHNSPFKGGHITRYFGKPEKNQHALQLEMNKILYMDDSESKFEVTRANQMRSLLKKTFTNLITEIEQLQ